MHTVCFRSKFSNQIEYLSWINFYYVGKAKAGFRRAIRKSIRTMYYVQVYVQFYHTLAHNSAYNV